LEVNEEEEEEQGIPHLPDLLDAIRSLASNLHVLPTQLKRKAKYLIGKGFQYYGQRPIKHSF